MRLGQFTFGDFYLRRITRIIPALLATIVLGLAVSIALMTPNDLVYAAKQGLAAVFSVSNIFFWLEADYWDPNSRYKVFLHTWSLGVEEQFYLLYPLMLWLAFRLGGRNGIITLLLLMLIGGTLASELWLHSSNPAVSFYLTPLRSARC